MKYRIRERSYPDLIGNVKSEFSVDVRMFYMYWKFLHSFSSLEQAKIFLEGYKSAEGRDGRVVYSE